MYLKNFLKMRFICLDIFQLHLSRFRFLSCRIGASEYGFSIPKYTVLLFCLPNALLFGKLNDFLLNWKIRHPCGENIMNFEDFWITWMFLWDVSTKLLLVKDYSNIRLSELPKTSFKAFLRFLFILLFILFFILLLLRVQVKGQ